MADIDSVADRKQVLDSRVLLRLRPTSISASSSEARCDLLSEMVGGFEIEKVALGDAGTDSSLDRRSEAWTRKPSTISAESASQIIALRPAHYETTLPLRAHSGTLAHTRTPSRAIRVSLPA